MGCREGEMGEGTVGGGWRKGDGGSTEGGGRCLAGSRGAP